jgi:hypothetical protein
VLCTIVSEFIFITAVGLLQVKVKRQNHPCKRPRRPIGL